MSGILRASGGRNSAAFYRPERDHIAILKTKSPGAKQTAVEVGVWIRAAFRFGLKLKKIVVTP